MNDPTEFTAVLESLRTDPKIARLMCAPELRSHMDVDDLIQTVALKCLTIETPIENPAAYVQTAALNAISSARTKQRCQKRDALRTLHLSTLEFPAKPDHRGVFFSQLNDPDNADVSRYDPVEFDLADYRERSPCYAAELQDEYSVVRRAIKTFLQQHYRIAILTRCFKEYSFWRIGRLLGCNSTVAKNHYYRGIRKLRSKRH